MAEISEALILAAGRGMRMGPRGEQKPKGLIAVGDASLLSRSLEILFAAGIQNVTIVTGHLCEQFEEFAPQYGSRVKLIHNPNFATMGSFESLCVGLTNIAGPCLVLESDIIYERRAVQILLESKNENSILTSGPTMAGDEVYVWGQAIEDSFHFQKMSKSKAAMSTQPLGELSGILKISQALCKALLNVRTKMQPMADYEAAINGLQNVIEMYCDYVPDLVWGEIDDENMLLHITTKVWPKIVARDELR